MEPHILRAAGIAQYYAYPSRWSSADYPMLDQSQRFSHVNANACVWQYEGMCVVGIAGTNDVYDLVQNLTIDIAATDGGIAVHRGMLAYTQRIAYALRRSLPRPGDQVILCGHSLGGAAAMLLPLVDPKWHDALGDHGQIITFGSPRCIQKQSVSRYSHADIVTRVVRELDVVPDIPLTGHLSISRRLAGWSHVGQELYFDNDNRPASRSTLGEITRRVERFIQLSATWTLAKNIIEDWHDSEKYMEIYK